MTTEIITTKLTGPYFADDGDNIYIMKSGSVTTATTNDNGVQARSTTDNNVNVLVEGTIVADAVGVYFNSIDTGNGVGGNTIRVGAHGTIVANTGIKVSTGGSNTISVDGEIQGNFFGIYSETTSSSTTINVGAGGVISARSAGIDSRGDFAKIFNSGSVFSGGYGISVRGNNSDLANSGVVTGASEAVHAADASAVSIANSGTLQGATGMGLYTVSGASLVHNSGQVLGTSLGIYMYQSDASIFNSGTITGRVDGIRVDSVAPKTVQINNAGMISGDTTSITSLRASAFDVRNSGTLGGDIVGGDNADSVVNSGAVLGNVALGDGIDTYRGAGTGYTTGFVDGGAGDDVLKGGSMRDDLRGGAGKDDLRGRAGDDILSGGDKNDTVKGGAGDDDLAGGANKDSLFGGAGNDTLSGDDGDDYLKGGDGDDELNGGNQADDLRGGRGDDLLSGGSGDDRLFGGSGNDTLTGDSGKDSFVFASGGKHDTITDFQDNIDTIELEQVMWGGGLTATEVVTTFATVVGANTVFDFGGGDVLVVAGVASAAILNDDVLLV